MKRRTALLLLAVYVVVVAAWHANILLNGFGVVSARTFDASFYLGMAVGVTLGVVLDRFILAPAVEWHAAHARDRGRR